MVHESKVSRQAASSIAPLRLVTGTSREDADATDRALRQGLKGFDRPTLLLWGEKDRIVPLGFAAEWQEVLPRAEIEVIPDGGHLLFDEFPAAVEAMRRFLKA